MKPNLMLTQKISDLAEYAGIDLIGFTDASPFSDYALKESVRMDPKISMHDAQSIIVAGIYIGGLTLPVWAELNYGRTSRLYLSGHFCDVVKPLEPIADLLRDEGYNSHICKSAESKTSILPLKLAAIRAGFGWQGKCSLLITKKYGSYLALGGIITNAPLEHNTTIDRNRCGRCEMCMKACPTASLNVPYVIDKKSCLAYNLQMPEISVEVKRLAENRVGDCEICQDVCPWNQKHLQNPVPTKLTLSFREKIAGWEKNFYLPDLVNIDETGYSETFGDLETTIPFSVFHRNVVNALENAKNQTEKCS